MTQALSDRRRRIVRLANLRSSTRGAGVPGRGRQVRRELVDPVIEETLAQVASRALLRARPGRGRAPGGKGSMRERCFTAPKLPGAYVPAIVFRGALDRPQAA